MIDLEQDTRSISYWQQGVNDARAGLPLNSPHQNLPGYEAGWNFGIHGNKASLFKFSPEDMKCPHCGQQED